MRREGDVTEKYLVSVGKAEGKRQFVRPRHRWKDNIKADREEKCWDGDNWINLTQDDMAGCCQYGNGICFP